MTADDHGSSSTYTNHGCRCDACSIAWARQQRFGRASRVTRLADNPTLADHGSPWTYNNWGCRCRACTDAWSAYRSAHREQRKQDAP